MRRFAAAAPPAPRTPTNGLTSRRAGRGINHLARADRADQAHHELQAALERGDLDPLGLGVVVAPDRAEAVQRGDAPRARPAAVRDAAGEPRADVEAEVAGVAERDPHELLGDGH